MAIKIVNRNDIPGGTVRGAYGAEWKALLGTIDGKALRVSGGSAEELKHLRAALYSRAMDSKPPLLIRSRTVQGEMYLWLESKNGKE